MNPRLQPAKLLLAMTVMLGAAPGRAADGDGNYAVIGMGRASCHSFLAARDGPDYARFKSYVGGYLTAYNALATDTYSISANRSFDELMAAFAEYCRTHRMDSFDRAVQQTLAALTESRQRRAPIATGGWSRQ